MLGDYKNERETVMLHSRTPRRRPGAAHGWRHAIPSVPTGTSCFGSVFQTVFAVHARPVSG
jgi:hypothetical protein